MPVRHWYCLPVPPISNLLGLALGLLEVCLVAQWVCNRWSNSMLLSVVAGLALGQ